MNLTLSLIAFHHEPHLISDSVSIISSQSSYLRYDLHSCSFTDPVILCCMTRYSCGSVGGVGTLLGMLMSSVRYTSFCSRLVAMAAPVADFIVQLLPATTRPDESSPTFADDWKQISKHISILKNIKILIIIINILLKQENTLQLVKL